jgi:trigger factor
MTERSVKAADAQFEQAVMDALIAKVEADIPECMFEVEVENILRDYDNRLRMQGLDLATYFKYTGMNLDTMRAQFRPQAEQQVRLRLGLEKIAELEAVTVSAEEIAAEYARIAEAYNMPEEEVRKLVDEAGLVEDLRVKAAADIVKAAAVAVAAAPAKKVTKKATTAKKATAKKAAEGEAEATEAATEEKPAAKKTTTRKKAATTAEGETEEKAVAKKPAAKKTSTTTKKTTTKKAAEGDEDKADK